MNNIHISTRDCDCVFTWLLCWGRHCKWRVPRNHCL